MTYAYNPSIISRTAFAALALVTVLSGCEVLSIIPDEIPAGYEVDEPISVDGIIIPVYRSEYGQRVVFIDDRLIHCDPSEREACIEAIRREVGTRPQEPIQDH